MTNQQEQKIDQTLSDFVEFLGSVNFDCSNMQPRYNEKGKLFFDQPEFDEQYKIFLLVYRKGFMAGRSNAINSIINNISAMQK